MLDALYKGKGCVGRAGSSIFLYTRGSSHVLRVNGITGVLSTLTLLPPDPNEHHAMDFTDDRWMLRVIGGDDGIHPLRTTENR